MSASLGEVTLRPHQVVAVDRLLQILEARRGALLADSVGLGKTYVALAVARAHSMPLVVCPAALRAMWERASAAAGIAVPVFSIEALSRGARPSTSPDLVIVDEAHHLRTPGTRRYEAVAELARHARILLVSATPLQNSRRDLTALLALFAGSGVRAWTDAALARLIVRRDALGDEALPALDGPHSLSPGADDDCLDAILAIPHAVPAADEGAAHALTTISLLHLWASSRAALLASVKKRLARAIAMRAAIAAGHVPTAAELASWRFADDALQLAFPLFAGDACDSVDLTALGKRLDGFAAACRALVATCAATAGPDLARAMLLRDLRRRHEGARIVAFSQYATTVLALGRLLRGDAGIAVITADAARIAHGPVTRAEVLAQLAGGAPATPLVERIGLLLTTDLLSEGIDLRGASVIVHLDLPWNPARIEQRVGRARRIGSPFSSVHVYAFEPPTAAERMLELRRRLSAKARIGDAVVGVASPLPAIEGVQAQFRRWTTGRISGAIAPGGGWIATVRVSGLPRVIARVGDVVTEDPHAILEVLESIVAPGEPHPARVDRALDEAARWAGVREAASIAEGGSAATRSVLDRLSRVIERAPRHRRASVIDAARRTRDALTGVQGVGSERALGALAASPCDDEAWLRALVDFGAADPGRSTVVVDERSPVAALIVLEPVSPEAVATPG